MYLLRSSSGLKFKYRCGGAVAELAIFKSSIEEEKSEIAQLKVTLLSKKKNIV